MMRWFLGSINLLPPECLPADDLFRIIVGAGKDEYLGHIRSEPIWLITLASISNGKLDTGRLITIPLGASLFRHAPLLSL